MKTSFTLPPTAILSNEIQLCYGVSARGVTITLPNSYNEYCSIVIQQVGNTGNTTTANASFVVGVICISNPTLSSFSTTKATSGTPNKVNYITLGY